MNGTSVELTTIVIREQRFIAKTPPRTSQQGEQGARPGATIQIKVIIFKPGSLRSVIGFGLTA